MIHRPMVFLDIETTGGSPFNSRITEIGALRIEDGQVVGRYNQLLDPEQLVSSFITSLTGITNEMLKGKPTFAGIAGELDDFLRDAIFVAHNVSFDYGFIKESFRRQGVAFNKDRFCTARLSRRLYPAQRRHNLDTLIEVHSIAVAKRHRAFDDAAALYEFYQKALNQHGLQVFAAINSILVHTAQKT